MGNVLGKKGFLLSYAALIAIALVIFAISTIFLMKGCSGDSAGKAATQDQQQKEDSDRSDRSPPDEFTGPLIIRGPSVEDILEYPVGDSGETCAWQEFTACQPEEYCSQNQWAKASDNSFCCSTSCVDRIQAKNIPIEGIVGETITVEKFGEFYAVWWGIPPIDEQLDLSITGHENYAETQWVRENIYTFQADALGGQLAYFHIEITDKDTEIEAKQFTG